MPLEAVFKHLAKNDLFRLSWGAKNTHGEEWVKLLAEYEARLAAMCKQAIAEKWLNPRGVYGFWPAQVEGEDLLVYDPATLKAAKPSVLAKFHFPRQKAQENLSLADYFMPVESGKMDTVAFQVVTVGQAATDRFDRLQAAGDYSEAYFTHGLAVQTAEAAADYLHEHVRREMGIPAGQGKRYSWGYPAIPELEDHTRVFQLLPAEKELGMHLTSAYQMVPEQSTVAIIIHHPEAKYFNTGESRVEQLMKG
jgi:5-methyltetrahydrofolate--homocysteine methyltransferase